jgi:hypothetical protein
MAFRVAYPQVTSAGIGSPWDKNKNTNIPRCSREAGGSAEVSSSALPDVLDLLDTAYFAGMEQ